MTVFVANTNVLDLVGLKNGITGAFMNSATVTVTIKTKAGVDVEGEVWPLTMNYLASSDGNYRAFISEEIEFVPKASYIAHVEADGGANLVGHWEFNFKPLVRTVVDD